MMVLLPMLVLAACRPALPPPGGPLRPTPPGARCTLPSGLPSTPVALLPDQGSEAVARPRGTTGASMGYFERLPQGYAGSPQRRYPLVVFLHGGFETGHHLGLLDGTAAPGGRQRDLTETLTPERGGDDPFIALYPQRCSHVLPPSDLLAFLDHAAAAYRVDPRRVYLVGHSAGAAQVWRALPELAPRIAGVIALSGFDLGTPVCAARTLPMWVIHAQDDPVVPSAHSQEVVRRLRACPPSDPIPVRLTVLPAGGHGIDAAVLAPGARLDGEDPLGWLLRQRRP